MSILKVEFDENNKAVFETDCNIVQLAMTIASIEAYISATSGLNQDDIKAMVDECKLFMKATAVESETELIL